LLISSITMSFCQTKITVATALYEKPDLTSKRVVSLIYEGTSVQLGQQVGDFWEANYKGKSGYVHKTCLENYVSDKPQDSPIAISPMTETRMGTTNILSLVSPAKKGEILLADGTKIKFRELMVSNDSIAFINAQGVSCKYGSHDIYKITKTSTWAAHGAIISGVGGFLGSILGTLDWNYYPELRDIKVPYIIGCTIGSTVVGAITGALIKREAIIYKNSTSLSFMPSLDYSNDRTNLLLSCRINF
jgi:hypothetical protein